MANSYSIPLDRFDHLVKTVGWVKFKEVLNPDHLQEARQAMDKVQEQQKILQEKNGVGTAVNAAIACLIDYDPALDRIIQDLPLREYIFHFFGKPFILNGYGGVINAPQTYSYVNKPHRDVRDFTAPFRLMINMMIMVDDFTLDNGATYVLPGSHIHKDDHEQEFFHDRAERLTGKAGDIVLWDSNLLHAAGENHSSGIRRALTLTFCRPYVKPIIEFKQALDSEFLAAQNEETRMLLGLKAQAASSIDAFFQPPERWTYKMQ